MEGFLDTLTSIMPPVFLYLSFLLLEKKGKKTNNNLIKLVVGLTLVLLLYIGVKYFLEEEYFKTVPYIFAEIVLIMTIKYNSNLSDSKKGKKNGSEHNRNNKTI